MNGIPRGWSALMRIAAFLFMVFMLAPLIVIVIASFTDDGYVQFPPSTYGIRWYRQVFQSANIMGGVLFSFEIALAAALLSGLLGVASALALSRANFRGRDAIVYFLTMPLSVPHVVLALAFLQVLSMVQIATSPWGIVASHILITTPYVLRLAQTSLADLDQTIERASYSLGATPAQTFRMIILPMIAPGVIAGVFFAFLLSFDEVTISIFLSTPGKTTLPAQIFAIASTGSDPIVTATSGLLIIVAIIAILFIEKFFGSLRLLIGGKI